uniref:Ubiquitin-like domain-containing protein n=1 Tax=Kalanchoe fedtschenkoi TaxID=63787 RepID=A0A7N0T9D2_KALFE
MAAEEVDLAFPPKWRRRSASLTLSPSLIIDSFSRKSLSYSKLPSQTLRLTVRKLDGSSFDIEVVEGATVAQLKEAVEDVFSDLPRKGPDKISWPHVWGHFCLCFAGEKLLCADRSINGYGVRDGDQLHFVRHVSFINNAEKTSSKKHTTTKQHQMLPSSDTSEARKQNGDWRIDIEKLRYEVGDTFSEESECTMPPCFMSWFSYSKIRTTEFEETEEKDHPFKFTDGLCCKIRQLIGLPSNKPSNPKWNLD